jgi:DNA-binding TFAR19-related protein (PDSD5 family)
VAAECLLSSVRKRPTELQELRRRVREVNYAQARNVELGELLKAIYVLGDGTLLAEHLRQRQAHGRLKGIARQISQAFTGDEPAVRATLVALERLGKSATAFSQPLLQPLQSRDLKISAGLQKQAAQLWLTWRYEYQFRIFHLILLASGLGLQNLLADEIRQLIGSLLEQRQWVSALWVIQGFGLQPEAFMEAAAEQVRQLLDQGQWNQAVLGIQVFGLPQEVYAEAAAAEVRRLLEKGHWDSALRRIRAFRLQKKAFAEAVAAQVMQLLDQGQWKAALRAIRAFGLQREAFAEAAAAGIRRLLERQQWKVALQAVKAFGLATCYPPEPIIQKLLQHGQWQASLRGIHAFGLRREAFAEAAAAGVQRLLEQERWDKALQGIQAFGLTTRYPPEPIIQKLLQQGRWQASLRGIQAFGLQREAFAEAAAAGVQRLLEQERWVEALQGIQAFGLTTRYPPEPIIQKLLQQGQWQATLRGIRAFGLQREAFGEAAAAGVQRLLEQERWDEALQGIQAFGLATRYPPEPIIEKLVQQGQWQTALRRIEAFGLQTEAFVEAAAAGVWRLLEQEKWGAAVQGIQAFGLAPELSAEMALAIVGRFLVQGLREGAVTGAERLDVRDLLHKHLHEHFADRIHAGGEKRKRCLDWMTSPGQSQTRLRNGVATVLLRRYGDVENALALVGSLGFTREHIEHNRALIERVEKINQALAQTGALPDGEDMRDLELFGYVHESGCILAPGFRDFRTSESAKQHGLAGRVVRFWLVVERHPADNRPVLNATNLVPV